MSDFKDLFASSGEGFTVFLLHVGPHDEVAVYRLDDQGRPIEFAAGRAIDVLAEPIRRADPCVFITRHFERAEHLERPGWWFSCPDRGRSWREVVAILNSRRGEAFLRTEAQYWTLRWFAPRIEEFITLEETPAGQYVFSPTPTALEADARLERSDEETSSS
jgi:hypothetical protein